VFQQVFKMRWTLTLTAIFFAILISGCKTDNSTSTNNGPGPKITGMNPTVVNPGTTGVEGRIQGSHFQGLMSVSLGDGIGVEQFTTISDSEIYIFFSVNKDAAPGPRDVIVATNSGATNSARLFTVGDNRVPEAKFTVNPFHGIKDDPFRFDATASNDDGPIVSYKWKFGDGKQDSGRVVTHRYGRGGTFDITLTVTDNKNLSVSTNRRVDVDNSRPPVAAFTVNPTNGSLETNFSFDASQSHDSDGQVTSFFWNFGDGFSANGKQVQHKYQRTGSFGVTLTIADNSREPGVTQRLVTVGGSGGPGGGGPCANGAPNRGLIFGSVVGVDGFNAIVQFPSDSTCANTFYKCGDMRKASPENFYGIITQMTDLGGGKFSIYNNCPFRWPPPVGEQVFLIYKTCSKNFCP
jgi:PKD repeat protein